nr:endonuclease MutS2 [bacterium]
MMEYEGMRPMNARAQRVLEYHKVLDQLAGLAVTEGGKALCLALKPVSVLREAELAQQETSHAESELYRLGASPIAPFTDTRPAVEKANRGGVLSPRDLLDVAQLLAISRQVRASLCGPVPENDPRLQNRMRLTAMGLGEQRTLEEDIRRAILGEDEISDYASPQLGDIRRGMRRTQDKVREKLDGYLHSVQMQKYLQDVLVTQRGGRFVLPVKAESRSMVPGLVHDQSASGATVFIEPMAVVELNNKLKQLEAEEREEIQRILAAFSARVAAASPVITASQEILYLLDFAFAKAALSRQMRGIQPRLNQKGIFRLVRARHPLIAADAVVPIDVNLGREFDALVITGPNTGGKTVTLKTCGLISLMAAAGLHIPCDAGSEAAIFYDIFADIGDEQSIEQSLSTFSSHMKNIVSILEAVRPGTLVLLDELGAGTDPAEGAALAIALLEHIQKSGARVVATTHYSELKAYALTTPGVENASMEFDVATLRPTYRLSIGIPGKSNAFAISGKLGLGEGILNRAKELLSAEDVRFEDVISSAQEQRQLAEKERAIAEGIHQEAVRLREESQRIQKEIARKEEEILRKAREEARRTLNQAREQAERALKTVKRAKQENNGYQLVREAQRDIRDALLAHGESVPQSVAEDTPLEKVTVGQKVRIIGVGTVGTVLTLPDGKGDVQLQAGSARMKVALARLCAAGAESNAKKPSFSNRRTVPNYQKQPESREMPMRSSAMSVDVRGQTLDEALLQVDAFIDGAILSGFQEVMIIHGKGTGVLRAGIQQHLRANPQVKSVRDGRYGEGEQGVSVVTLK